MKKNKQGIILLPAILLLINCNLSAEWYKPFGGNKYKSAKTPTDRLIERVGMPGCDRSEWEDLIAKGADLNAIGIDGQTAMHKAACCDKDALRYFILKGAKLDTVSRAGYTPLHFAVNCSSHEAVRILLAAGAKVDVNAENGVLPLHLAVNKSNTAIAKLLIDNGAVVNSVDANHVSPLHIAVKNSNTAMVELLLANNAMVNLVDKNGKMPLHYLAEYRHMNNSDSFIASKLVQHGANPDLINTWTNQKFSARDVAIHECNLKWINAVDPEFFSRAKAEKGQEDIEHLFSLQKYCRREGRSHDFEQLIQ